MIVLCYALNGVHLIMNYNYNCISLAALIRFKSPFTDVYSIRRLISGILRNCFQFNVLIGFSFSNSWNVVNLEVQREFSKIWTTFDSFTTHIYGICLKSLIAVFPYMSICTILRTVSYSTIDFLSPKFLYECQTDYLSAIITWFYRRMVNWWRPETSLPTEQSYDIGYLFYYHFIIKFSIHYIRMWVPSCCSQLESPNGSGRTRRGKQKGIFMAQCDDIDFWHIKSFSFFEKKIFF